MRILFGCLFLLAIGSCRSGISLDADLDRSGSVWNQFGGGMEKRGAVTARLVVPPDLLWSESASGRTGSGSPVAMGEMLFVPSLSGGIDVFNIRTGQNAGHIGIKWIVHGAPVIIDSLLIVPLTSYEVSLIAYNLYEGSMKWWKQLGPVEAHLLGADGQVIAAGTDGNVWCIRARDSSTVWNVSLDGPVHSPPSSDGNRVLVGCDNGDMYSLALSDGSTVWRMSTGSPISSAALVHNGRAFFCNLSGHVFSADIENGNVLWERDLRSPVYGSLSTDGERLHVPLSNGSIAALSITSGEVLWLFQGDGVYNTTPLVIGNTVVAAGLDSKVRLLSSRTGEEQWSWKCGARIKTSPIYHRGVLIVCDEESEVYAFGLKGDGS